MVEIVVDSQPAIGENILMCDRTLPHIHFPSLYCFAFVVLFEMAILPLIPQAEIKNLHLNRVLIDDFELSEVGELPSGWKWKNSDSNVEKPYIVKSHDQNKFLSAKDHGQSVILAKHSAIDIQRYPYISFRWRAHALPSGGDERYGDTNDSAAAVYIIYKMKFGLIPVSIKYVWSSTLSVGTATKRDGTGRPWNIVADTGRTYMSEWRTHIFDIYSAYEETFGGKPPRKIVGIAILSDANATNSTAYADYDDIIFLSDAEAHSGIEEILREK